MLNLSAAGSFGSGGGGGSRRSSVITPVKEAPKPDFGKGNNDDPDGLQKLDENDFARKLHFAVWPMGNRDRLEQLLRARPEELHGRFGCGQETLLHR